MLGPDSGDEQVYVNVTATCTTEEQVVRVTEAFSRAMTGLALEGINCNLSVMKMRPED